MKGLALSLFHLHNLVQPPLTRSPKAQSHPARSQTATASGPYGKLQHFHAMERPINTPAQSGPKQAMTFKASFSMQRGRTGHQLSTWKLRQTARKIWIMTQLGLVKQKWRHNPDEDSPRSSLPES